MDRAHTDIYAYTDFRAFLREAYLRRKASDTRFSHRFINGRIGARSAGWFSDVTENRMGLKSKYVARLASVFGLKPGEAAYFRMLVELDQAETLKDKTDALQRLMSARGLRSRAVGLDQFEFYSAWYHSALREVLALLDFRGDFEALGKLLNPPLTAAQTRKSIMLLAKLGLIRQSPTGRWVPQAEVLVKDSTLKSLHWARIQRAFLELALPAIEDYDHRERDFSSLTLSFSAETFRKAGEEIAALRKRLLALSERDAARDRVYQCNFQVFPLSRTLEVKHAE